MQFFLVLLVWPLAFTEIALASAPVSLAESYRAAVARSEVVGESREQVRQADLRVDQVRGGIFPQLSFNLHHLIQPEPSDPVAREFSPGQQTTMNFSVSQPVFRGLREFNGLSQLRHLRSSSEAQEKDSEQQLFVELAAGFLTILSLEQDHKNLEDQLSLYEKRLDELKKRAGRGESNASEVVSAEATQAALSAELRLVEGQLAVSRETFHFLTGLDRQSRLVDPDIIGQRGGPKNVETYLQRTENRPDVQAAAERYEAARSEVSVAWGEHFPSVDIVGNYYVQRPGFLRDLNWDVGVRVAVPIFEGGATQARIEEAISKRKQAELALQRARRSAEQEIRSIHQRLLARLDHMTRLRRSTELSKKNTTLLQRDYRRGLARNIDVQTALAEFRIAQRSFDQARFSAQLDMLQLQAAAALAPALEKESTQ
jgi:outer membrane protein